jgi:MinD-like ATPase involved in chromosome partitioning or flagellar assembly
VSAGAIRTLVAVDHGIEPHAVENAFPAGSSVYVVGVVEGLDHGWTVLEESSPDLLLVACSGYSERALYLIEAAAKQRPDRPVVVAYFGSPDGFLQRAFEVGADDLLTLPAPPADLEFALRKVMARRRGVTVGTGTNPMISVLGPKGGTGKTLTACNLAVALAKAGRRPVVVDLDLQFGDIGMALGLSPERTIYDLARAGESLDADKVEDFLTDHPSGARALLAPIRPDQAATVTVEFLREAYAVLRAGHDYVIVDTPPAFTPEVIASIDLSSHLLVVGMLDAFSLKDTKLGLETLELMGCDSDQIKVVLNRADSSIGITREEAEAVLGRRPDSFVPSAREIARAATDGEPIVLANERSEAARAFRELAALYLNERTAADSVANGNGSRSRRGPLSALLRRGS